MEFHEKNLSLDAPETLWGHNALEAEPESQRLLKSPDNLLTDPNSASSSSSLSSAAASSHSATVATLDILPGQSNWLPGANGLVQVAAHEAARNNSPVSAGRPFFGDALYSFQAFYWPYHCVICLVICTLGIVANLINVIVLTRPNMVTAVNSILCAMALADLVVNISTIPYLVHELSPVRDYQWALYILFHAHTSVTSHTISIWLTCVLATWRYFVVCRSQSSNQRNWSVKLAKRNIIAVFLLVPIFCIPNYLSFAIVADDTTANSTSYRVGFSHLAEGSSFIRTFHFWIFSCLTKLVPCVLLTFFTTALIRKLLSARERRLRLANYGHQSSGKDVSECATGGGGGGGKMAILSEGYQMTKQQQRVGSKESELGKTIVNGICVGNMTKNNDTNQTSFVTDSDARQSRASDNGLAILSQEGLEVKKSGENKVQVTQRVGSSCATDPELIAISCDSSDSSFTGIKNIQDNNDNIDNQQQQNNCARILTQLIVEKTPSSEAFSTTAASSKILTSCDTEKQIETKPTTCNLTPNPPYAYQVETPRSASTSGALELYSGLVTTTETRSCESQPLVNPSRAASQDFTGKNLNISPSNNRGSLGGAIRLPSDGSLKFAKGKRSSEAIFGTNSALANRTGRGSAAMTPVQLVKLQAAQRQLSQNETTTRLLIAVMIVFLICEFPAGILAALCAVYGETFFENVYQPTGILTDLLALINSSVNFILYCCMSTQFRITFYRVVLRC